MHKGRTGGGKKQGSILTFLRRGEAKETVRPQEPEPAKQATPEPAAESPSAVTTATPPAAAPATVEPQPAGLASASLSPATTEERSPPAAANASSPSEPMADAPLDAEPAANQSMEFQATPRTQQCDAPTENCAAPAPKADEGDPAAQAVEEQAAPAAAPEAAPAVAEAPAAEVTAGAKPSKRKGAAKAAKKEPAAKKPKSAAGDAKAHNYRPQLEAAFEKFAQEKNQRKNVRRRAPTTCCGVTSVSSCADPDRPPCRLQVGSRGCRPSVARWPVCAGVVVRFPN